ncbi:MAG: EamA family transporter [Candidatus Woesearchaeota archaeon]
MATELWAAGLVIFATFIGAFGALFFKLGADRLHRQFKSIITNTRLFIGVALYGLSTIFFLAGLKGGELSVLYPLASLGYAWTVLLSIKILKEKMNLWKWSGIGFILLGVVFIGLGA